MKGKNIKGCAAALVIMLMAYIPATAQGPAPPPGGPGTSGPIDGGAIFFFLASALYGYYKLKEEETSASANVASVSPSIHCRSFL
jgi:hypothetical protein